MESEMSIPHVIIVGAVKGGVGKTFVTRVLADYFKSRAADWRAIDTQMPRGDLKRFCGDRCDVVDLATVDGQMRVLDTLRPGQTTLIDCQAGLLVQALETFGEIGFL